MNTKLNYKLKVVDNFLNQNDFNELSKLKIDRDIQDGIKVYHNEINNDGIIKSSG